MVSFKPPKYNPPPMMERSNKLLDERDARAWMQREKVKKETTKQQRKKRWRKIIIFSR